jgi:hypothetical protein
VKIKFTEKRIFKNEVIPNQEVDRVMFCGNCGNQASWREPKCKKCDQPLHQKNCKGRAADCKCHAINEQSWNQKKAQTEKST